MSRKASSDKGGRVKVKVIVRVRPFLPHELSDGETPESCIGTIDSKSIEFFNYRSEDNHLVYGYAHGVGSRPDRSVTPLPSSHRFDSCYDDTATQAALFARDVLPLLQRPLQGENACIFAYGPTGKPPRPPLQWLQCFCLEVACPLRNTHAQHACAIGSGKTHTMSGCPSDAGGLQREGPAAGWLPCRGLH